jgi:hypothetical protein
MAGSKIRLLPHSEDEFETAAALAEWLDTDLRCREGRYRVITTRRYTTFRAGDVVVFHRAGEIVGDAWLKQGLERLQPADRISGQLYRGLLVFDTRTIRVYPKTMSLKELTKATGLKVNPQTIHYLSERQYSAILAYVR